MKNIILILACALVLSSCTNNNDNMNLLVKFTVKPESFKAFKNASILSLKASRKEEGNIEMKLFTDNNNPNVLFVYSRWENKAAYEEHKNEPHTKELSKLVGESLQSAPSIMLLEDNIYPAFNELKNVELDNEKVILFFTIKIKDKYLSQVIDEFPRQVELTRKEPGNLLFNLYKVEGTEDTFVVYEQWKNQAALDNHFTLPYSAEMGVLLTDAVDGPLPSHMSFVTEIN